MFSFIFTSVTSIVAGTVVVLEDKELDVLLLLDDELDEYGQTPLVCK